MSDIDERYRSHRTPEGGKPPGIGDDLIIGSGWEHIVWKVTLFLFVLAWKFIRHYLLRPIVYVVGRFLTLFVKFGVWCVDTLNTIDIDEHERYRSHRTPEGGKPPGIGVRAWKFIKHYLLLPIVFVVVRIVGAFLVFFAAAVYTVMYHTLGWSKYYEKNRHHPPERHRDTS